MKWRALSLVRRSSKGEEQICRYFYIFLVKMFRKVAVGSGSWQPTDYKSKYSVESHYNFLIEEYGQKSAYTTCIDELCLNLLSLQANSFPLTKGTSAKVVCTSSNGLDEFCLQWSRTDSLGLKYLTDWLNGVMCCKKAVSILEEDDGDFKLRSLRMKKPDSDIRTLPPESIKVQDVKENAKNLEPLQTQDWLVGTAVVVPYLVSDDDIVECKWSRAQIRKVLSNNRLLVHLTDYGNEIIVTRPIFYKLPAQLAAVSPLCFRAQLDCDLPQSNDDLNTIFNECMATGEFNCSVQQVSTEERAVVSLYQVNKDQYQTLHVSAFLEDCMKIFNGTFSEQ